MKKTIVALLMLSCVSLFVVACESNRKEIEEPVSISEEINESESNDNFMTTFCKTSGEIMQTICGKDVDCYSENIDDYLIDVFPIDNYLLFFVTSSGDDFPSLIYAYDQEHPRSTEYVESLFSTFLNTLIEFENVKTGSYGLSLDSLNRAIYVVWIEGTDAANFPLTIQIQPDSDYFIYADTEEYKLACSEGRYKDILLDVQSYIDDNNPPSYDNAYILQSLLSPIVSDWEDIHVEYDSIENYATFTYSKASKIDNNIHFVPYALTNERNIRLLIGFYDTDWLFFDKIIISSDENINISASNGKTEKVIGGGKIYESYVVNVDDKILEKLLQSSNYTIRFKAKDGSFKDYTMSTEEYDALVCIAKFQNVRNILSDLLYRFDIRMS